MSVITFSADHVWCSKKYKGTWFNVDSLSDGPQPIQFRSIFARQGFGWIILWNKIKSVTHEESSELSSKAEQHLNIDKVNQLSNSSLDCRSKDDYFEQHITFDEPLLFDERTDSNHSNRFEILSSIED